MDAAPDRDGARVGAEGLWNAWKRSSGVVALAVVLTLVAYWWFTMVVSGPTDWAFDFRQFWQGGNDVVNGVSPYPNVDDVTAAGHRVRPDADPGGVPLPLPGGSSRRSGAIRRAELRLAAAIWGVDPHRVDPRRRVASRRARLARARSRRPAQPVITSVRLGTFTPVLLLLAAVAWRWRDRRWIAGGALAAALTLKLFLWPLLVWMIATRRFGAAGIATGLAVVTTVAAWAVIGFEGLTDYPELLRLLTDIVETVGLSLVALGDQAGLPIGVARALPFLVGFPLLVAGRRRRADDEGDRRAFSIAVIAAIAITPIVWLHYFTLLVAPLALARPRLAWPWALLWAFWLIPAQGNEGHPGGSCSRWLDGSAAVLCVCESLRADRAERSRRCAG